MAHRFETENSIYKFSHITRILHFSDAINHEAFYLVRNEDTIDIWAVTHKSRSANELVHYYKVKYDREIDETDLLFLM